MNVCTRVPSHWREQRCIDLFTCGFSDFAEVSEDFIEDDFNLTGLNALVPFYKEALEMVLDVEPGEKIGWIEAPSS
jgi:hypothetical protein